MKSSPNFNGVAVPRGARLGISIGVIFSAVHLSTIHLAGSR